jgi:hypothetical protein
MPAVAVARIGGATMPFLLARFEGEPKRGAPLSEIDVVADTWITRLVKQSNQGSSFRGSGCSANSEYPLLSSCIVQNLLIVGRGVENLWQLNSLVSEFDQAIRNVDGDIMVQKKVHSLAAI